jgi:hypothetical protein
MFNRLQQFRQEAYKLLGKAKDATFELMDAVLLTRSVYSFAELSPREKILKSVQPYSKLIGIVT